MNIRTVFILSFIANVILAMVSLAILPSWVAIHFGRDGLADGWAPSYVNTLLFLGINTVLFCSLYFTPRLVFWFPPKWINLPNKDYWLQPENKPRLEKMFSGFMWQFGTALFIFLFAVGLLTIQANLSQPVRLDEKLFFSALAIFLVFTIYWCIRLFRSFRIPTETGSAAKPIEPTG